MDFQKIVDSIGVMTCVVSVEKLPSGEFGNYRIVTGNKPYIASIENPVFGVGEPRHFEPNSLYTDYLPEDLNFESFCYQAAVERRCMHSYAKPDRFDVWFNMAFLPLVPNEGNLYYCTYSMEISPTTDFAMIGKMDETLAAQVLETCFTLRGATDFKAAMQEVISDIRKLCGANRCCIMLLEPLTRSCSVLCEDLAEGSSQTPIIDLVSDSFYDIAESWGKTIAGSSCILVRNRQDMEIIRKKNPVWHASLVRGDVSSIVLFPLKSGDQLLGYIWATNFDPEKAERIKDTLELTTFIVGSEIGNYLLLDRLRILSSRDMLTGLNNRNQMNQYVDLLDRGKEEAGKNVGCVFADLNGLKTVNDSMGHPAGDKLLIDAANALRDVFDEKQIFRAGGDEYVVILPGITLEELEGKVAELRRVSANYDLVDFAIGYAVEPDVKDVRTALRIADEKMYDDKKIYYRAHPEYPHRGGDL